MNDGRHDGSDAQAAGRRSWVGRSLAARHWRGELGLTRSLWWPAAAFGAVAALILALDLGVGPLLEPMPAFFLSVLSWAMALVMAVWLCTGLVRAGLGHGGRGGSSATGWFVAAATALAMLFVVVTGARFAGADLSRLAERVRENLPVTALIRPMNGGTELSFEGDIEHGAANALARAASVLPGVRLIRLDSMGGELREARRMRDFIAAKGWDTYTSGQCWSGCAIAYLGGTRRSMSARARMGFHSASVWPFGDDDEESAINATIAQEMIARGVDAAFARRAWSKSHDGMWFPAPDELIRSGLVHEIAER